MSKMMYFLFFIIISIAANSQQHVAIVSELGQWHSYPVPTDSMLLDSYASGDSEWWTVFKKDSIVEVVNIFYPDVREQIIPHTLPSEVSMAVLKNDKFMVQGGKGIVKVDDGYLIGVNHGEFGGNIIWYSKNGKKHYSVSADQVVEFIRKDGDIYAIQGLDHLGVSQGSLIRMLKTRGRWKAFTYHTLPYAPIGVSINSKNHFVIATSNSLLEINDNGKYITLIDNAFWDSVSYLYPNSLVIQNDIAYIGMRKGVFKLNLKTNKQEWLMKN